MKKFVGYLIDKAVRKLPRSKKVSPTIKSVKPTKLSVPKSIEKVRQDETMKRIYKLELKDLAFNIYSYNTTEFQVCRGLNRGLNF